MNTFRKILIVLFPFLFLMAVQPSTASEYAPIKQAAELKCYWPNGQDVIDLNFAYAKNEAYFLNYTFTPVTSDCKLGYFLFGIHKYEKKDVTAANFPITTFVVLVRQVGSEAYIVGKPTMIVNFTPAVRAAFVEDTGLTSSFYFVQFIPQPVFLKGTLDLDGNQFFSFVEKADLSAEVLAAFKQPSGCGFMSKFDILSLWDRKFDKYFSSSAISVFPDGNDGIWHTTKSCQVGFTQLWLGGKVTVSYFMFYTMEGKLVLSQPVLGANYQLHIQSAVVSADGVMIYDDSIKNLYQEIWIDNNGVVTVTKQNTPFELPNFPVLPV